MPPPSRKQPSRQAPPTASGPSIQPTARQVDALSDFRTRRIQRRLDELERTNPTDIPASSFIPSTNLTGSSTPTTPNFPTPSIVPNNTTGKKKQTANVRKILTTKKSLKDWLDELPSTPKPPYLLAPSLPPPTPPRQLCSSCGYIGHYKCLRCGEYSCDRACMEVHERDGGCGIGG